MILRYPYLCSREQTWTPRQGGPQGCQLDWAIFKTLDGLDQRLDKDWNAAEEDELTKREARYIGICQEIADIRLKWDVESLTAPFKAVEQDPQYRAARLAMADRVRELQKRIAQS